MRHLRRLLLLSLLLCCAVVIAAVAHWAAERALRGQHGSTETLEASRSYWLAGDDVLRFPLDASRQKLRLLCNAATTTLDPEADHYYAVHYRLLDDAGQALVSRDYHHRLSRTDIGGRPRRLFERRDALPADTNLLMLDTAAWPEARLLELRVGASSLPLAGIAIRPYFQEPRDPDTLDRLWQRLHDTKRQKLARANVFNPDFLSEFERNSLLRWRWRPLVPRGVEGEDYATAVLLDDPEEQQDSLVPAAADRWLLPAGRSVVLGLPDPAELYLTALSEDGGVPAAADLNLRWHGRLSYEQQTITATLAGRGLQARATLDPGLLVLTAQRDLWLEVVDRGQAETLLPDPVLVRGYRVDQEPLRIPVHHRRGAHTPIRLDFRAEYPGAAQVNVHLLGSSRSPAELNRNLQFTLNNRDWLRQDGERRSVSDARSLYLKIPAEVTAISISSSRSLWLSAYNRPPGLKRRLFIPESLFGGDEQTTRFPAWFVLAPETEQQLIREGASALIERQLEPPDIRSIDPELRDSERLYPEGRWQGMTLLTLNDPRREISGTALGSTYQPLQPGRQTLTLAGTAGFFSKPTLLVRNPLNQTGAVRLHRAGRNLLELSQAGIAGRFALPEQAAGTDVWTATAPPGVSLYLSDLEPAPVSYREQGVQRISAEIPFRYRFQRRGLEPETLALRVFTNAPGRVRLQLTLDPWQQSALVSEDWTPTTTTLDLALEPAVGVLALEDPGQRLTYEALAFVGLGTDVPTGPHALSLRLLDSPLDGAGDQAGPPPVFVGLTRSTTALTPASGLRVHQFEVSQR